MRLNVPGSQNGRKCGSMPSAAFRRASLPAPVEGQNRISLDESIFNKHEKSPHGVGLGGLEALKVVCALLRARPVGAFPTSIFTGPILDANKRVMCTTSPYFISKTPTC
jgi:hypothetical protein